VDAVGTKYTVLDHAISSKDTCSRFSCYDRCAANAATSGVISCAPSQCWIGCRESSSRHRVNRQIGRSPTAALHRDYAAAILAEYRPASERLPGAGGRLQQYWVSNTGCPGPSGGPCFGGPCPDRSNLDGSKYDRSGFDRLSLGGSWPGESWHRWLRRARGCDFIFHLLPCRLPYLPFSPDPTFSPSGL
jgi:hypothetical protein